MLPPCYVNESILRNFVVLAFLEGLSIVLDSSCFEHCFDEFSFLVLLESVFFSLLRHRRLILFGIIRSPMLDAMLRLSLRFLLLFVARFIDPPFVSLFELQFAFLLLGNWV